MATVSLPRPKPKRNPSFWQDNIRGYLFILPVVLGLIIWTFGPMVASAFYSLTNYKITEAPTFIGFQNFSDLFQDDLFIQSLSVTLRYAILYMIIGQIFGLALAILLTQKARGMALFRTAFYLPIIVPYVASALLWRYLYNNQY